MTLHRATTRVLASIGVIGALTLAACGSDDESSPTTTPDSIAPTTTDISPTTELPSTEPPSTDSTPPSSDGSSSTTASTAPADPGPPDPAQIAFNEFATVPGAVDLTFRAGDPALYVVSQDGLVMQLRDGAVQDAPVLDVRSEITAGGEQGLLGLAFAPDGEHAYINATNIAGGTEIIEYAVDADGVFDPMSKRLLMQIPQPYPNHNGGQVRFGPDGFLYIGMGDGGSGGDPDRRALDPNDLLGKMLRIDPAPGGDAPFSIPEDNPFIDGPQPSVFSIGLRNPWRFSFDAATGDLWIADVGQGDWEEINVAWADQGGGSGVNFGWSAFEGTHRFNEDQPADGAVAPIFEYQHGERGCSVSGGVRSRAASLPSLTGWYVYGDYCNGEVRALQINDDRTAGEEIVLTSDIDGLSAIAQGPDNELYALSVNSGGIFAIQPAG